MKTADKNRAVAIAFLNGQPMNTDNMFTDGKSVWSYRTVIAETVVDGDKTIKRLRPDARSHSETTSRQVNILVGCGVAESSQPNV